MKRFTKILAVCVLVVITMLSFTACVPSKPKDIYDVQQNFANESGYHCQVYTDKSEMEYVLKFDIKYLSCEPTAVLIAQDEMGGGTFIAVEFENQEDVNYSFPALVELTDSTIDSVDGGGTYQNMFYASSNYRLSDIAFQPSGGILDELGIDDEFEEVVQFLDDAFEFLEEEVFEKIVDLFENHNHVERPEIDLSEVKGRLEGIGYIVSLQTTESSSYLFAVYGNQFVSFFQAEDEYKVEQEYNAIQEMWDDILAESASNGVYELTYGKDDDVVYYGSTTAVYDALGYYVEPKY